MAKIVFVDVAVLNNFTEIQMTSSAAGASSYKGNIKRYAPVTDVSTNTYWPSTSAWITWDLSDDPDAQTGIITLTRANSNTMVLDSRTCGTGNPDFGQIFESTGTFTISGTGNLTFATSDSSNFQSGTIALHLYR
jgi:hypothetical protein